MIWADVIKPLRVVESIQKNSYYHEGGSACILYELILCRTVANLCLQISVSAFGPSTVMSTENGNTSRTWSLASGCLKPRDRQLSHMTIDVRPAPRMHQGGDLSRRSWHQLDSWESKQELGHRGSSREFLAQSWWHCGEIYGYSVKGSVPLQCALHWLTH